MGAFQVGLFDDAEKLVGQGTEDTAVAGLTQQAEQFLDSETGNKFDSEIAAGGTMLDQQVDKELPNL
jgi:hypothetical protein